MKTCANCGHTMEDADVFCGNCGAMSLEGAEQTQEQTVSAVEPEAAPVPEAVSAPEAGPMPESVPAASQPVRGGKSLWKIGAIAAAAVVVLVVAVLGITGALKSSNKSFADIQRDFLLEAGVQYVEQFAEQYEALTNLSTDLTVTVETDMPAYEAYFQNTALQIGLETKRDALAVDANFRLMGSDILSGLAQLQDGTLRLALPEISDQCYVLDLKQMIYEATGVEVTELALPELSKDTMVSLVKNYFEIVVSTANDDNVTVEKNSAIELPWLGQTVDGTRYTFRPTAADVEGMLLRLADALETDEELRNFVVSLTGNNLALVESAMGITSLNDTLEESLGQAAAALRDSAAEIGQTVADAGFTWTVGYADGRVVLQYLTSDEGVCMAYESQGKEDAGRTDVLYVQEADGTTPMAMEAEYTKQDGKYSGNLRMTQEDEVSLDMTFADLDGEQRSALGSAYGSYSFSMEQYGTEVAMEMTVEKNEAGGTDHRIAMSSPEMEAAAGYGSLTINIHSSDETATIRQPEGTEVDITTLDDSDLEELSMLIQQHLMSVLLPLSMGALSN